MRASCTPKVRHLTVLSSIHCSRHRAATAAVHAWSHNPRVGVHQQQLQQQQQQHTHLNGPGSCRSTALPAASASARSMTGSRLRQLAVATQASPRPEPQLKLSLKTSGLRQFEVYTSEGNTFSVRITPGVTTVGDLRALVADKTGQQPEQVRLAYAGRELQPSTDGTVFDAKPDDVIVHTMPRTSTAGSSTAATSDHSAGQPPLPPLPHEPQQLTVMTMEGKMFKVNITPGKTTVKEVRHMVAEKTRAVQSEVRLSYAGKELDPTNDNAPFIMKPKIQVIQALQRMKGGAPQPAAVCSNCTGRKPFVVHPVVKRLAVAAGACSPATHTGHVAAADAVDDELDAASEPVTAPGAGYGSSGEVQLAKQFRNLKRNPIPGISAAPDDDDPLTWHIKLAGPEGTAYAGGWFDVTLKFTRAFPGSQPYVRFETPIWHPNVASRISDGSRVCIDLGANVRSVACVLTALQMLLAHPNPASPVNHACADDMMNHPEAYEAKARKWTQQYAVK